MAFRTCRRTPTTIAEAARPMPANRPECLPGSARAVATPMHTIPTFSAAVAQSSAAPRAATRLEDIRVSQVELPSVR